MDARRAAKQELKDIKENEQERQKNEEARLKRYEQRVADQEAIVKSFKEGTEEREKAEQKLERMHKLNANNEQKYIKKRSELSSASVVIEKERAKITGNITKVLEKQKEVSTEIAGEMTGLQSKFNGLIESLPFGNIISKQAGLGKMLEQTTDAVAGSLQRSFLAGESGVVAFARAGKVAMRGFGMAVKMAMGPLLIIGLIVAAIIMLVKHMIKATNQARMFSKELGVANAEGQRLQQQFGTFHAEQGIKTVGAMNEQLGYSVRLTQESVDAMNVFNTYNSMSAENLGKVAANAELVGSNFAEVGMMAKEFATETTGELDILKEIASLSKDTVGHFAGRTKEMVRQAKLAKEMNISLEKTMQVSKGLLDIESSIEAEMTARLLTGKDLNFDAARQLALQGDSAGAVKEITDQVGSLEGMDMIQLDALASATGLSVGELQGTAAKSDALDNGTLMEAASATTEMRDVMKQIRDGFMQKLSNLMDKIISNPIVQKILDFIINNIEVILIAMAASLVIIAAVNTVKMFGRLGRDISRGFKGLGKTFSKGNKVTTKAISNVSKNVAKSTPTITKVVKSSAAATTNALGGAMGKGFKSIGGKAPSFMGKVMNFGKNVIKKGGQAISATKDFVVDKGSKVVSKVKEMSPKNMFGNLFKGKTFGVIKKFLKGSGILNVLLELAEVGMIMATDMPKREKSRELVRAGSSVIGSLMGGGLGSLLGPAGTFLGSIGGSLLGNWVGSMPAVQDALAPFIEGLLPDDNGMADDFIVQDNKLTKFRKDDIIIGGTNIGGGDQDSKIVERLDTLIELMMAGKVIEMDGIKVAEAMALNNLDVGVA
jgi:hypothetical protein